MWSLPIIICNHSSNGWNPLAECSIYVTLENTRWICGDLVSHLLQTPSIQPCNVSYDAEQQDFNQCVPVVLGLVQFVLIFTKAGHRKLHFSITAPRIYLWAGLRQGPWSWKCGMGLALKLILAACLSFKSLHCFIFLLDLLWFFMYCVVFTLGHTFYFLFYLLF